MQFGILLCWGGGQYFCTDVWEGGLGRAGGRHEMNKPIQRSEGE